MPLAVENESAEFFTPDFVRIINRVIKAAAVTRVAHAALLLNYKQKCVTAAIHFNFSYMLGVTRMCSAASDITAVTVAIPCFAGL